MERNYSMDQKFFDEAAYLELFEKIKSSSDPDAGLDLDALNSAMESTTQNWLSRWPTHGSKGKSSASLCSGMTGSAASAMKLRSVTSA